MPAGRPTLYKAEYVEQAAEACLRGKLPTETNAEYLERLRKGNDVAEWLRVHRLDLDGKIAARNKKRSIERKAYLAKNPSQRVRNGVAARLWAALKGRSDGRLFSRLGYTVQELMSHLESRFTPGMRWANYGRWHVDHKKPCALFDLTDQAQFAECWALHNLQPLWAEDNTKKGKRYAPETAQ